MALSSSLAAASPSVSIVVESTIDDAQAAARVEAVRRRLLADALRQGYCLRRSDAEASLHIELGPAVHRITARGTSMVEVHLEGGGLVADLEVIHRSRAALVDAVGITTGDGCVDGGSVELRVAQGVDQSDEERLVAGLVDAGYAVVPHAGDAVVCVRGGPQGGTSVAGECEASAAPSADTERGDLVQRALEVIEAQVEAPRDAAAASTVPEATVRQPPQEPKATPESPPSTSPSQAAEKPRASRATVGGRVDVSAGILVRERSVDPAIGIQGGPLWRGRWGLELMTAVAIAPLSSAVTALDVDLGMSASHTWTLHPRWSIAVGLGGGARFHPYFVHGRARAGATTGQAQASLVGRFTPARGVGLGIAVRPVVAGHAWEHVLDGVEQGRRTLWGVRFALELGWGRS